MQSFNQKGNPYNNTVIEYFHATLKRGKLIKENIIVLKKHIDQSFNLLKAGTIEKEFIAVSII